MTTKDFGITACLSLAAATMSYLGLNVPEGYEALHLVSAVAMASGYVFGRDFQHSQQSYLIITCAVISAISVTAYYISINYVGAGIRLTILLSLLAFCSFWPASYILAIAHNKPAK
ncbi:hypothetical protein N2599_13910 [Rhizobium sullae]|uniref:Uncharacterized protein n=1 Tax=Rhizobium sullae TaxID=50338 RepID=A0ABY5XGA8_RHISU|nr:hypothetical protein [Rhizobium sullae]UWU13239.1 hypothetical protein N2599_13910 [Rhizobium sullae]